MRGLESELVAKTARRAWLKGCRLERRNRKRGLTGVAWPPAGLLGGARSKRSGSWSPLCERRVPSRRGHGGGCGAYSSLFPELGGPERGLSAKKGNMGKVETCLLTLAGLLLATRGETVTGKDTHSLPPSPFLCELKTEPGLLEQDVHGESLTGGLPSGIGNYFSLVGV